jgi:hypothetical protein
MGSSASTNLIPISRQRWHSLTLWNNVEKTKMAHTGSRATETVSDRVQLLPTILDRTSSQILSRT